MLNSAMIIGRLGKDPEIRQTQSNNSVCNFSVATSEKYTKDGQTYENTEWHRIVVWGKQAENCQKYLKKGSLVFVEGKLTTRKWNDKNGHTNYTTEINAFQVKFLSSKENQSPQGKEAKSDHDFPQNSVENTPDVGFPSFDEIPF